MLIPQGMQAFVGFLVALTLDFTLKLQICQAVPVKCVKLCGEIHREYGEPIRDCLKDCPPDCQLGDPSGETFKDLLIEGSPELAVTMSCADECGRLALSLKLMHRCATLCPATWCSLFVDQESSERTTLFSSSDKSNGVVDMGIGLFLFCLLSCILVVTTRMIIERKKNVRQPNTVLQKPYAESLKQNESLLAMPLTELREADRG